MAVKLLHNQTSSSYAAPENASTATQSYLVTGLTDSADALDTAVAQVKTAIGANLLGQYLHPNWPSTTVKPEATSFNATYVRGYADATDGAIILVLVEYGFIPASFSFGKNAIFSTSRASRFYFASDPKADYTDIAGGQTTTDYHKNAIGAPIRAEHSFNINRIKVAVLTATNQASWASSLEGKIMSSAIVIAGRTYAANTLLFQGIEQTYNESQRDICMFNFEYRPTFGWMSDDFTTSLTGPTSVADVDTAAWVPPTL